MTTPNHAAVPMGSPFSLIFGMPGRRAIALVGMALVLLYSLRLFPEASASTGSPMNRVTQLQLAHTVEAFGDVLVQWSATKDDAVRIMKEANILRLDSTFPAVYGVTFAFLYAWLTGRREPSRVNRLLFFTPLAAAAFDYVENMLELVALSGIDTRADVTRAIANHTLNGTAIFWQSACAHVKYALLALWGIGAIIAVVQRAVRALRR